jgi:CRP/FNR family transcriptional activator FtrB
MSLMKTDAELLDKLPFLDGLDPSLQMSLLRHAQVRSYPKGKLLFEEGGSPDCLFVLLRGMVELFTRKGKKDVVALILWPNEVFMPAAALYDEPYLLSGRTLSSASALLMNAAHVREQVGHHPELAERLTRVLAGQFRMAIRHIKDLKLRNGPERLGAFLYRLAAETGKNGYADLPIPKAVLASRLGLSAETLSRSLHTLSHHGLTMRGSRIIITDPDRLSEFCGPDPLIDGRELNLSVTAI